jgi:hypothetical protein
MVSLFIASCIYVATREFGGTPAAALALAGAAFGIATKLSVIMERLERNARHAEVTAKVLVQAHQRVSR